MDTTIENNTGKKARKDFRRMISSRLSASLLDLKEDIKEKKYNAAIKRASKLLANDLFVKTKKEKGKVRETSDTVIAENIGA